MMKAFVLMPFSLEFQPIFEQLIGPPLEEAGFEVSRADSVLDQRNILNDIVRGIHEADLVVADLTGLNPNVLYELGICHGLNIPVVLLTQDIDEVPFDLRAYRLQVYSTAFHEAQKLAIFLKKIGNDYRMGSINFGSPVSDFLRLPPPRPSGIRTLVTSFSQAEAPNGGSTAEQQSTATTGSGSDSAKQGLGAQEDELGWLDLINERDSVLEELTATYELMAESISEMGNKMGEHASHINDLVTTKVPGAAGAAQKVAALAARDMEKHSLDLENLLPDLEPKSERLIELLTDPRLLKLGGDPEDSQERHKKIAEFKSLLEVNQETLASTKGFRNSITGLREQGISRETNRAASTLRLSLDKVIQTMELVESGLVRVVALLEEVNSQSNGNDNGEPAPGASNC